MYRPNPVQAQAPARLPPHIEAALRAAGLGMSDDNDERQIFLIRIKNGSSELLTCASEC